MDSQLFRLNQMSYQHHQHILNQHQQQQQHQRAINNRQHYSNRQQQQQQAVSAGQANHHHNHHHHQASSSSSANSKLVATASGAQTATSASSGSDQDEQVQLSSLSTATNKTNASGSANSQAAILGPHSNQTKQLMMAKQQQQQQRQHQQQAVVGGHRQAALQAHNLTVSGGHKSAEQRAQQHKMTASDQLTTSSDQTIDDLHQLAPHHHSQGYGHHHRQHHLTGASAAAAAASRFDSSQSNASTGSQSGSRFLLGVLFTIAELLLFATVLLWLYWAYQHDDGLAWQSDRKQQFNTHAALMLFGFIFLSGQAMLIHRSFSCCSKIYTKILHTILFVLATSAISLGLILAYTAQENVGANNKPIMHFYSLHAWCGLTTVALFVLQFVFGFVSFLILLCCDQATANYRAALLPIHKTFGLIIFSLAIATCLTGLLQTARSRLSSKLNKIDYHELAEPGIIINLIGCCLIALAILMPYIIRNLDIKRSFKSELDRHLNKLAHLDHHMRI